jgi:bacitracin transport system permease protein
LVSLLQCEFMKLRRSKMLFICILGAMVTPFMIFVEILKKRSDEPGYVYTYYAICSNSNFYMILLFGLLVYTVFAAYIFSREYTDQTLKNILTIPVSKDLLLISKFLVLMLWCVLLSLLAWFFCLVVGFICGAAEFDLVMLAKSFWESIYGTALLVFTLTPLIYLSIRTKGIVIPVITSATILMINAALSNEKWAALFPWSSTYFLVTQSIGKTGYPETIAITIIVITSLTGTVLSFWYFKNNDVK